jgi:hypothetical protein
MNKKADYITDTEITEAQIESLARCLLPEIQRFFESGEGKREFDNWKMEQAIAGKDTLQ